MNDLGVGGSVKMRTRFAGAAPWVLLALVFFSLLFRID